MRKENLITRTITSTIYDVMCVDVTTATCETIQVTLSGSVLDPEKALKRVSGSDLLNGRKAVAITNTTETSNLYGMTDTDFIKYARIIKEGGR